MTRIATSKTPEQLAEIIRMYWQARGYAIECKVMAKKHSRPAYTRINIKGDAVSVPESFVITEDIVSNIGPLGYPPRATYVR